DQAVPSRRIPRTAPSARQNRTTPVWRLLNCPQLEVLGPANPCQVPPAPKLIQVQAYCRPESLTAPMPSPNSRVLLDPSEMPARVTLVRLSKTPAYFAQSGSMFPPGRRAVCPVPLAPATPM